MYSVVMMMVMSGAPEMPSFGGNRGCHGCNGCQGVAVSCYGGCHGGCRGVANGCVGCNGGCRGYACNGCYGGNSCNGCHGGHGLFSRFRNRGCHGGNSCCGCHGGNACYGGCTGVVVGCTGGMACQGGVVVGAVASADMPATVCINVPANAKVFFDGAATTATGSTRNFTTPALTAGVEHSYTVTAELDGKKTTARVLAVRAGEVATLTLTDADFATTVASK
ncbi:MAG: TIGR03000 domain-containing protein [Gemmataceae bacterium]|nr:TIGR03000 domain-containing protein [Gemmataceae bacterium]